MRDVFQLLPCVLAELRESGLKRAEAERLCLAELGFLLTEIVDRDIAVSDAWTLFSGYPFAQARVPPVAGRLGRVRLYAAGSRNPVMERIRPSSARLTKSTPTATGAPPCAGCSAPGSP